MALTKNHGVTYVLARDEEVRRAIYGQIIRKKKYTVASTYDGTKRGEEGEVSCEFTISVTYEPQKKDEREPRFAGA